MDTNVAIYLRDRKPIIVAKLGELPDTPAMSILTRIELENGVYADPSRSVERRAALDAMIGETNTLDFDRPMIAAYASIVKALGYSRPRSIDRMIAATAIVHGLTLIVIDAADFRDIPGLSLEIWPAPVQ